MGVSFKKSIEAIVDPFEQKINRNIEKAHMESAFFMSKQIDISFENEGDRGAGTTPWKPTSRAAKMERKTYPKKSKGQKTGKKGFTQAQARYLFAAPTLKDTGALKNSNTVETGIHTGGILKTYSGTGKTYIKTHEDGGTINVDGETFVVDPRPSHYFTDSDLDHVADGFEKAVRR